MIRSRVTGHQLETDEEQMRLMATDFIPRWSRQKVQTTEQLFHSRRIQEDKPLAYFLASYRQCLHFQDNGVFMQAHAIDGHFWALRAVEIASIMRLPADVLLLACHETAYKLLGNIFIPAHAAVATHLWAQGTLPRQVDEGAKEFEVPQNSWQNRD